MWSEGLVHILCAIALVPVCVSQTSTTQWEVLGCTCQGSGSSSHPDFCLGFAVCASKGFQLSYGASVLCAYCDLVSVQVGWRSAVQH